MDTRLSYLSFRAEIIVDDQPLPIYGATYDENARKATCWVPSAAGKAYGYRVAMENDIGHDCGFYTEIDGKKMASYSLRRWNAGLPAQIHRGEPISATEMQSYRFANVSLRDDPTLLQSVDNVAALGTIIFKIKRVLVQNSGPRLTRQVHSTEAPSVHERAKKMGGHATTFGAVEPYLNQTWVHLIPYPEDDIEPWVTLEFKYQSKDTLQARGIIPREVNAMRPLSPGDDESEEEEQREEAEIAALKASLDSRVRSLAAKRKLKPEQLEENLTNKRRKVKQEEVIDVDSHFTPGEVIDLTDL